MRWLLLVLMLLALPAAAQEEPAALVADVVRVEGLDRLVAEGNVEVIRGELRLSARRIAYDRSTGRLQIDGPITLVDGTRTVILADAATLDSELRDGILTSARIVLDQQMQIAANQVRRVNGRYTEMTKTVASSCQVCAGRPVALWSIRAKRVVHDQLERQMYFEDATFRVMDVPVFWLPRLRLPDPTLERATGFLIPNIRTTNRLGTGIKVPYFVVLGRSRDLTLTPYLSPDTRTLELRYRQAFRAGTVTFDGAVSKDSLRPGRMRGYLFGEGSFVLPRQFRLSFGMELVSDPAYLLDYGYSDKDRLQTFLALERFRRTERIEVRVVNFRTLRESEIPIEDQLPYLVGQAEYERRLPGLWTGEGRLELSTSGHGRTSDLDVLGRDTFRLGLEAGWRKTWLTRPGIEAQLEAQLRANSYFIAQDSTLGEDPAQVTPAVGMTLRWPFAGTTRGGASDLLEPVAQVVWSDTHGAAVPNEDSTLVEFDEGNLVELGRFPGHDRDETGLRAALGVSWTRFAPGGWSLGVTAGRIFRSEAVPDFTDASGLEGQTSDWLAAVQVGGLGGLQLNARALIADDGDIAKAETRLTLARTRLALAASHVWVVAEPDEGRPDPTHELNLDTAYSFTRHWQGAASVRYDIEADRAASAGLGLLYRNECVTVDLSLSRRFTSSTSLVPTTDVGLKVSLNGFGSGDGRAFRRTCPG